MLRGSVSAVLALLVVAGIAYVSLKQVEFNVPDSPGGLVVDLVETTCSKRQFIREMVQETIDNSKSCITDSDCAIAQFGCPFGCYTPINSRVIPQIETHLQKIEGCPGCRYRCPPLQSVAVCEDQTCQTKPVTGSFSTPPGFDDA